MKYGLSVLLLLFLAFSTFALPCRAAAPADDTEHRIQMMADGLSLTPEQVTKLRTILGDVDKQAPGIDPRNAQYRHDAMRMEKKKHESTSTKILAILTPEQRLKFQEMRNAQPNRQLLELKHKLSLTDEQMRKVQAITQTSRGQMEALRQTGDRDPKKHHKAMKNIMETQAKEIEKILSPEQKKAFAALRREKEKQMRMSRPR
jgi:Spy/CpxP family protein refolding chaperone